MSVVLSPLISSAQNNEKDDNKLRRYATTICQSTEALRKGRSAV